MYNCVIKNDWLKKTYERWRPKGWKGGGMYTNVVATEAALLFTLWVLTRQKKKEKVTPLLSVESRLIKKGHYCSRVHSIDITPTKYFPWHNILSSQTLKNPGNKITFGSLSLYLSLLFHYLWHEDLGYYRSAIHSRLEFCIKSYCDQRNQVLWFYYKRTIFHQRVSHLFIFGIWSSVLTDLRILV